MTTTRIVGRRLRLFAMCSVLLLAGCGSDSDSSGPGYVDPAGSGTLTLLVSGTVSGSDVATGIFVTDFSVDVQDTSAMPVSSATVSIQGPFGTVSLTEEPGIAGTYTSVRNGYVSGTYILSVVRGTDQVIGVRVSAPDIHSITSHAPFDTIPANQIIVVQWTRAAAADFALVETRDFASSGLDTDTGSLTVPAPGNPPRTDQRIRVWRGRRQSAAGGLPGSDFTAEIRNSVEPIICQ